MYGNQIIYKSRDMNHITDMISEDAPLDFVTGSFAVVIVTPIELKLVC